MVPDIIFATESDSRILYDTAVTVECDTGYSYGGSSANDITCVKDTENFPSSCRSKELIYFFAYF